MPLGRPHYNSGTRKDALAKIRREQAEALNLKEGQWVTNGVIHGLFRRIELHTGLIIADVPLRGELTFLPDRTVPIPKPQK